jgi:DNA topoisomerase IB
MARLRRSDSSDPGIRRRARGRGFEYLDDEGERVDDLEVLERIRELAIPPAWTEVWICPYPMGHIQAVGTDAKGRRQYRYHQKWRERRDQEKFDEMILFARALPAMRLRVEEELHRDGVGRDRVLACALRLLDVGFFRVGGEDYAAENETYGLATMLKEHVTVGPASVSFDYPAKSGKRRVMSIVVEPEVREVVTRLRRRRGGGDDFLAFQRGREWLDVRSDDINAYLKETTGGDFSAKDFRTWNATVQAAVALAVSGPVADSKTGRKRAIARAVKEVAYYLGNTPAVARASYIDPRVFDRYAGGLTIGGALEHVGDDDGPAEAVRSQVEQAVLDLIAGDEASVAVERAEEIEALVA